MIMQMKEFNSQKYFLYFQCFRQNGGIINNINQVRPNTNKNLLHVKKKKNKNVIHQIQKGTVDNQEKEIIIKRK